MRKQLEELLQESPPKRWLKLMAYVFLAVASLLFSILCILSIVGLPLGILNLGLVTSSLIGAIIHFIGLTSLSVGSGILSLWSGLRSYKQFKMNQIVTEAQKKMDPEIDKAITKIKKLKNSLASLISVDQLALQQTWAKISTLLGDPLKVIMQHANGIDDSMVGGRRSKLEFIEHTYQPLLSEISNYNNELVRLQGDTLKPVFYLYPSHINSAVYWDMSVLSVILLKSGFEVIDFTSLNVNKHLRVIIQLILNLENNEVQGLRIQLPKALLQSQDSYHQELARRAQQLNYAAALRAENFISYLQDQQDGLLNFQGNVNEEHITYAKNLQTNLSSKIETIILSVIPETYHSSESKGLVTNFNQAMIAYNQKILNCAGDVIFYINDIKKYTAGAILEKLSIRLKLWGFKTLSLSEVEAPKNDAENESQTKMINNIIQYHVHEQKIPLKLELPKWYRDNVEHAALVVAVEEKNTQLGEQRIKEVALIVREDRKSKTAVEERKLFSFLKGLFKKASDVSNEKENKLLEARANILMLLGLVEADTNEELLQQAMHFEQKDIESHCRKISMIFHTDKSVQNSSQSEQAAKKARADYCSQSFGAAAPRICERVERYLQFFGTDAFNKLQNYKNLYIETYEEKPLGEVNEIVERSRTLCEEYINRSEEVYKNIMEEIGKQKKAREEADTRAEEERKGKEAAEARADEEREARMRIEAENAKNAFNTALQDYEILPQKIPANENNQFKAVEQAYAKVNNNTVVYAADQLRQMVVAHIRNHKERFEKLITQDIAHGETQQDKKYSSLDAYLSDLEKPNIYGDKLSLQALAEVLGSPIVVLQASGNASKPVTISVIQAQENKTFHFNQALILVFNGQHHYNACSFRGNADFEWAIRLSKPEVHTLAKKVIVQWRGVVDKSKSAATEVAYKSDTLQLGAQITMNN